MAAEGAGALADGGTGGDDVIDEADGEAVEGGAFDPEGSFERPGAFAEGAARLSAGIAGAEEGCRGAGKAGLPEEQFGLVEAAFAEA